jgi:ribonuclease Y
MPSFFSKIITVLAPKKQKPKPRPRPKKPRFKPPKITPKGKKILAETQAQAREIIADAKNEAFKIKQEADRQAQRTRKEAQDLKDQTGRKSAQLDRQAGILEERERTQKRLQKELQAKLTAIGEIKKKQIQKLERAAGLTKEEAKKLIIEAVEKQLTEDLAKFIKEKEEEAKEKADKKAQELLVEAMHKAATDYVAEYTVSTIKLPDEDVKGRIIGKEGRNIRTFEKVTGVDVDLDETPGVVRLSSFDSVRREVAKLALKRLIADGRIQPTRIEEIVKKTQKDVEKIMMAEGEKLCHTLKVYNLPREIVAMLGRFKYRFSFGQNMITHTLEETKIGVTLASEIGANLNIVRLGCLLHDIGKVIEGEGTHIQLGAEFLRKYHIPPEVIACVEEHHEDKPFSSPESVLVYIADAISGSRPGARLEDYEAYLKRLEDLEEIAKAHEGVKTAYAIQAGREVRVIVNPEKISDAQSVKLSHDLKKEIEKKLTFPGQIKITIIRETRVTETAK